MGTFVTVPQSIERRLRGTFEDYRVHRTKHTQPPVTAPICCRGSMRRAAWPACVAPCRITARSISGTCRYLACHLSVPSSRGPKTRADLRRAKYPYRCHRRRRSGEERYHDRRPASGADRHAFWNSEDDPGRHRFSSRAWRHAEVARFRLRNRCAVRDAASSLAGNLSAAYVLQRLIGRSVAAPLRNIRLCMDDWLTTVPAKCWRR